MASWRNIAFVVAIAVVAIAVGKSLVSRPAIRHRVPQGPDSLIRITPQRIPIAMEVAALCFAPQRNYGPHLAAQVHIFANRRALDYRRAHPNEFDYPVGSMFLKEKYSHVDDPNPDLATMMERTHATGEVTDWKFSMISLPDKAAITPAGDVTCAECHQAYRDTGYISAESEAALREHLKID